LSKTEKLIHAKNFEIYDELLIW